MPTKIGLSIIAFALVAAGWLYGQANPNVAMPLSAAHAQVACAGANCIKTMSACREEPISGWNDSLYAAAKAPGVELRPCRATTELAQGD